MTQIYKSDVSDELAKGYEMRNITVSYGFAASSAGIEQELTFDVHPDDDPEVVAENMINFLKFLNNNE